MKDFLLQVQMKFFPGNVCPHILLVFGRLFKTGCRSLYLHGFSEVLTLDPTRTPVSSLDYADASELLFHLLTSNLGIAHGCLDGRGAGCGDMPQVVGNFLQVPSLLTQSMSKVMT
jgi:hypothetical protein